MKRITFSADANLIDVARVLARDRGTRLNDEIRRWLSEYASGEDVMKNMPSQDAGNRERTAE